jgi:hypothetical protein
MGCCPARKSDQSGAPGHLHYGCDADEWSVQGVPKSILLSKPFAPAQLVTAVAQLLNESQPTA